MPSVVLTGREGRKIEVETGLFINNQFVPSSPGKTFETLNPFSQQKLADVSAASVEDVDIAVRAAETAFYGSWKETAPAARGRLLSKLADLIERDADILATIEAVDAGVLFDESKGLNVTQAVEMLRYFAAHTTVSVGHMLEIPAGYAYTRREPFGVTAAIVPWNAPLMISVWKIAPAIAAGNVLILKTPELAPLYGQHLAKLIIEANFPPGVINILPGLGHVTGQALSEHMKVRKLAFTGSGATGRRILEAAAKSNLKKVTVELGGKGASIVFDDADLDNAIFWTKLGSTAHNGQVCAFGSRIYVQDGIYEEFLKRFKAKTDSLPVKTGDPLDPASTKGPIISRAQTEKVNGYIEKGKQEGAEVLFGGTRTSEENFVDNTIFIGTNENMTIVKEEIFGPVATLSTFSTESEAVSKANNSEFGLNSAIFTKDSSRSYRVSSALECGTVTVNCWGMLNANTPFGGVKQSGFGRDMGSDALHEWTTVKTVKHFVASL